MNASAIVGAETGTELTGGLDRQAEAGREGQEAWGASVLHEGHLTHVFKVRKGHTGSI